MTKYIVYPFGKDGDKTVIPDITPVTDGSVTWDVGFGPDYSKAKTAAGEKDVPRTTFNQLMFDTTSGLQQYQQHGVPEFISTADNLGTPFPYDTYAIVRYNDGNGYRNYQSIVTANTSLPTDATKWIEIPLPTQTNSQWKNAVVVASTRNATATYANGTAGVGATLTNAGTQVVFASDGVTPPVGSLVMIMNQTTAFQNGVYILSVVGSGSTNWVLTRPAFYDQASNILVGDVFYVQQGTTHGGEAYVQNATVTTIGTDAINFQIFISNSEVEATQWKNAALVASTGSYNATYANGTSGFGATLTNAGTQVAFASDGITPAVGSLVMIMNQPSAFQNGVYILSVAGSGSVNWVLTRPTFYDQANNILIGDVFYIQKGNLHAGNAYVQTGAVTTVGTDAINFQLFVSNLEVYSSQWKNAAYAATTEELVVTYNNGTFGFGSTLTNADTQAAFSLDDVTVPLNSPVIIKDQIDNPFQNGLYILTNAGSGSTNWVLTRPTSYDQVGNILVGDVFYIQNGTDNHNDAYAQTAVVSAIGTSPIVFELFNSMPEATSPDIKNLVIGGDFTKNPFQRGDTFATAASETYVADGFQYISDAPTAVLSWSKGVTSPTVAQCGVYTTNNLRFTVATAQASLDPADFVSVQYRMEGVSFAELAGKPFTLSFWVSSAVKTGNFSVAIQNFDQTQSYVAPYTISETNIYRQKVITIPFPVTGTFKYDAAETGINIIFIIACGTFFRTTTPNQWVSGVYYSMSGAANGVDSTTNAMSFNLVQVTSGDEVLPFIQDSPNETLQKCQRFFQKSYNLGDDPGTVTTSGCRSAYNHDSPRNLYAFGNPLPVQMCQVPDVIWYSTDSGDANKIFDLGGSDVSIDSTINTSAQFSGLPKTTSDTTPDSTYQAHYVADASLT